MHQPSRAVLLLAALAFSGCTIPENQSFKLGVPHRQQLQFNYCVPASVLMWRLHDGLPEISQHVIFEGIGGTACTVDKVPAAVSQYTGTFDTFADVVFAPTEGQVAQIVARQITSVGESRVPTIAVVGAKNHVGVLNGGKYHHDDPTNLNVWDLVYFHDPDETFGNLAFTGSQWLDFFCREGHGHCAQVVSSSAIIGWDANLGAFGNSISFYGEPAILNQDP